MNNIDLAINALRKQIGINEMDEWDFPTRMRIRQTLENVLIILNSEKEQRDE